MNPTVECSCQACKSERESELLAQAAKLLLDFAPHSEAWNIERRILLAKIFPENGRKA